jgi:hypothetical protein
MPRQKCGACEHDQKAAIDAAIKSRAPLRAIAKQFGLSVNTIFLHSHHDDEKQSRKNIGEIARIEKEIVKLHAAQNRAKRRKNSTEALAISRELRNWHSLRLKAVAIDAARVEQADTSISPVEALQLARSVVEANLHDQDVLSWLRSMLERVPAALEAREAGNVPDAQE